MSKYAGSGDGSRRSLLAGLDSLSNKNRHQVAKGFYPTETYLEGSRPITRP